MHSLGAVHLTGNLRHLFYTIYRTPNQCKVRSFAVGRWTDVIQN